MRPLTTYYETTIVMSAGGSSKCCRGKKEGIHLQKRLKREDGDANVEKLIGTNTEYFIKCTVSNIFCLSHSPMAYKNALFFLVNYFIITLL